MGIIVKGNLTGEICSDYKEPLFGSTIRFYSVETLGADIIANVAADPKETIRILTDKEVKSKSKLLIAEAEIDKNGNYKATIKGTYEQYKGPLMIDIVTKRVYRQKSKDRDPIQFTLTIVQPKWTQTGNDIVFNWKYCINHRFWCHIRELFNAWVICGRLLNCNGNNTPIPGVTVTAMDDDWITDDVIGSDVTNNNGGFRIDYTNKDFKQTFLSPIINIETPFPPFNSGPDVYFRLAIGSTPIVFETPSDKRNNVGPCLCVHLCIDEITIPDLPIPPSFTNFGLLRRIKIQDEINPANGKTLRSGFNDYAFYKTINLIGTITKKLNGSQMEYLFEYQQLNTPSFPIDPNGWLPIVPNMIPKTVIGNLVTITDNPDNADNPVNKEPYYINGAAPEKFVEFNGNWIKVPQESNFEPHQDAEILKLDTSKLAPITAIDMSLPTSAIGSITVSPIRPHTLNRYVVIRMRQRETGNETTEIVAGTSRPIAISNVTYNNVNKNGSWAPKTKDNQLAAVSVDIQEVASGSSSGCNKITNALHITYGARNENLGAIALTITGPIQPFTYHFPAISLMPTPETFGTTQLDFIPNTLTVKDLLPCAYTIQLTTIVKLTTGDGEPGAITDFISFCKV